MSGGVDKSDLGDIETAEITKRVMADFETDEKTAERILAFCAVLSLERNEKWKRGIKKLQKDKAEEIYQLTSKLKRNAEQFRIRGDAMKIVAEIEKRILAMCTEKW